MNIQTHERMCNRIDSLEKEVDRMKNAIALQKLNPEFLTFSEVKKFLGIGDKLARRIIRQGRIPVIRISPRKCIFRRDSVLKAMNAIEEGGVL